MVVSPHPITVTVTSTDNSTVQANVRVYLRNVTKGTTLEKDINGDFIITDSSGIALLDAANFPIATGQSLEYEQDDVLLIIAYDGQNHDAARYVISGDEKSQTLNLNPVVHEGPATKQNRIITLVGGNTTGTLAFFKVYAVSDGELLAHVEVPVGDTRTVHYGDVRGKGASGGFVIEREDSGLIVTASVK